MSTVTPGDKVTFGPTGQEQTVDVSSVKYVNAICDGGGGGGGAAGGSGDDTVTNIPDDGSAGARVSGVLDVRSIDQLLVYVGDGGSGGYATNDGSTLSAGSGGTGRYNGGDGATAQSTGTLQNDHYAASGGGGAASDIKLSDGTIIVESGGGGGGNGHSGTDGSDESADAGGGGGSQGGAGYSYDSTTGTSSDGQDGEGTGDTGATGGGYYDASYTVDSSYYDSVTADVTGGGHGGNSRINGSASGGGQGSVEIEGLAHFVAEVTMDGNPVENAEVVVFDRPGPDNGNRSAEVLRPIDSFMTDANGMVDEILYPRTYVSWTGDMEVFVRYSENGEFLPAEGKFNVTMV